jgi:hypothetical protein
MFVNIRAYAGGSLLYEVNPYDALAGTLKGLDHQYAGMGLPNPEALDNGSEAYLDKLVYEMHPESDLTGEPQSFHFALATGRHKDNRIPPKGFDIANASARLSVPVYYEQGYDVGADYFTSAEYVGGYDEVTLQIPVSADTVEVNLYYQTTSREYVEFLRDEINGIATSLPTSAYIAQTDPFFTQLAAWGDTIWNLWAHNMDVGGAKPILMTSATVGAGPVPDGCTAPAPTLLTATSGQKEISLTWSDESGDPSVTGYKLYYDQAGKAQLVADAGLTTTYVDTGLTDGFEYCYKITSYYDETCESGFSSILCATPASQGQQTEPAGVSELATGIYTGKGKNQTWTLQTTFTAGDAVVIRARILDATTGLPIEGATVELLLTGPEGLTLTTAPSDIEGFAEAVWNTKSAGRKNSGTATGTYRVDTKTVSAAGYHWDGVVNSTQLEIQ